MNNIKVTATWTHPESDQVYTIEATIAPGQPAPPQDFARFQEPDDDDEIQITSIKNGDGIETDLLYFSVDEIEQIVIACLDSARTIEPDHDLNF